MNILPIHNGIDVRGSPILFEEGDDLEMKYSISRVGHVTYDEYMKFLHEAYKSDNMNINNDYNG